MLAIPTDVYENGDLVRIEFYDTDGEFIIQAEWDPNDEQTSPNRELFRKWAYTMVERNEYEVAK